MKDKVNVLGTTYEIHEKDREKDINLENCIDGYTDPSVKKIAIAKIEKEAGTKEAIEEYRKEVLRHEIIHAFLYESGLATNSNNEWAVNEEIIDWIAIQGKKLYKAWEDADAI